MELLEATATSLFAPPRVLVRDINWRVARGEFWVVGGVPGSGKSALLATAAGLTRPGQGQHRLFGADTSQLPEEELLPIRRKVGMVFADGGRLFRRMSVAQNLALPLKYHFYWSDERVAERVAEILERTGLSAAANEFPDRLPRLLWGRVALARALALDPELVVVDKPAPSFDARQARWWSDFLKELIASKGSGGKRTVIVATDDFRPWLESGCCFGLIHDRKWVEVGGNEELQQNSIVKDMLSPEY